MGVPIECSFMPDQKQAVILLKAKHAIEATEWQDFITWAGACLEDAHDTPSLRILAGLNESQPSEVEHYLHLSLNELGWLLPSRDECLFRYAQSIARLMLIGEMSLRAGAALLYKITISSENPDLTLNYWLTCDDEISLIDSGVSRYSMRALEKNILDSARILAGVDDKGTNRQSLLQWPQGDFECGDHLLS